MSIVVPDSSQQRRRGRIYPAAVPVAIVLAAVIIQASPLLLNVLEYNRQAIASGQWWRLITCHMTHWSWHHAACDLSAFGVLWWMTGSSLRRTVTMTVTAAAVIGVAMLITTPDILIYRGMSGVGYALFGAVLASARGSDRTLRLCVLCFVAARVIFETTTSIGSFWLPDNIVVVGVTHSSGLMTGVLFALAWGFANRAKFSGCSDCDADTPD